MGNTLQKILQGRGDKKRQGFRIKRVLPVLLLFLTYLGLILEVPQAKTAVWFSIALLNIVVYAAFHIFKKEKAYSLEFLFSILLIIPGVAQAFSVPWVKTAYFPFMVAATAFYGGKNIVALLVFIPFMELRRLWQGQFTAEDGVFFVFLAAATGITFFLKRGVGKGVKEPGGSHYEKGHAMSYDGIPAFHDERGVSYYLETTFKPEDEIKEILAVAKGTLFADSVNLFVSAGDSLRLRCSTQETGDIILAHNGIIHRTVKERTSFVASDIIERRIEVGYLAKADIASLISVPVLDDTFPLGVMSADSGRYHAFSSADRDILQTFSNQVMRILQRERIYPQINRAYASSKILNEESSKLLSTLNIDVIAKNLMEGARRIAPSEVVFLLARGGELELLHRSGPYQQEQKAVEVKGTLLDMVLKNKEPVYISDVRNARASLMPFKTENTGSLFVLPLVYERDVLGMIVLMFEKMNSLGTQQIELLGVLGNQASTSIANANFYKEIERLAVTDGLTGLFNHRHFQEKLSEEFSRLERFSEPISLLLIDIDHFKKINDTYGHPVGDAVLKKVAGIIRKTIRNIDIAARYGGEEFAVILLGTDTGGAQKMAERLRKTVAGASFSSEKTSFNVTISIGISTYALDIKRKEELVDKADKALYHAKGTGRNRSVLWNEIKETMV